MRITLPNLLELSKPGLFALINDSNKKFDVRYGSNLLFAIARLISEIRGNTVIPITLKHDLLDLRIEILEKDLLEEQCKLRHNYWINHYHTLGYIYYRKNPGIAYSITSTIDRIKELDNKYYFIVKLVGKGTCHVIGVFDNVIDHNTFIQSYYSNVIVDNVVYSSNILTSRYNRVCNSVIGMYVDM
jgi:hypothetical protein